MHEAAKHALKQQQALADMEAAMRERWPGSALADPAWVHERFPQREICAAWQIPASETDGVHDLTLILPDLFPYARPQVALTTRPPLASLPHVEEDGVLCLSSGGTLMELPADIRHAEFFVTDALRLIDAGETGANRADFIEEISTYWTLGQQGKKPFWLITHPKHSTRRIYSAAIKSATVIGDKPEQITEWLNATRPGEPALAPSAALHVALPAPVYPKDYPNDVADLAGLIAAAGPDALDLLASSLFPGRSLSISLSFEHEGNTVLLGLHLEVPQYIPAGRPSKRVPIWHGFRRNSMPSAELLKRAALAHVPCTRDNVTCIQSAELLHRTAGPIPAPISNSQVAVIGCGALGGATIQLLAQAGIRRLTLIDADVLTWQNIGRHVLSSRFVGHAKAKAMETDILSRFPDYDVQSIHKRWERVWQDDPAFFDKHDLVVALTGEWLSDGLLNQLTTNEPSVPPVIFGWLEAHGLAGHALTVLPGGGCLRCETDNLGAFQLAVTNVPPEHALQREAGCGAFFQPFSAASAAPVAALIARTVLDALGGRLTSSELRTWVGSKDDFDTLGATINGPWAAQIAHWGFERIYRQPVLRRSCPVCGIY